MFTSPMEKAENVFPIHEIIDNGQILRDLGGIGELSTREECFIEIEGGRKLKESGRDK